MKRYDFIEVMYKDIVEWKCDVCGMDLKSADVFESQEAVQIHGVGGYGSIFGDGTEYYVDMCQHCFNKILGEYINIVEED